MIYLRAAWTRAKGSGIRGARGGFLAALLGIIVFLTLGSPAFAQQDPCSENGPDCRLLTAAEINALKGRLLALRAALPVPDPARWTPAPGVGESFTMSFVGELNAGGAMISGSWPAGAFTERNDVHFIYDGLIKPAAKQKDSKDPLAAIEQMQAEIGNRVEVLGMLLPHAYLVDNVDGECVDINDSEPTDVEKTPTFLTWMSNEGTNLTMIFGPRTCKEAETLRVDRPAKTLAPVKCITLKITGPNRAEVAALKKKIDRKAFEALLGPVMK
ncbi:MAG: hypothetical protein NT147_09275 [Candidatus Aminicenantes bacterium]|nr:hypothetical protein [Candidatus Aminicenantes bacterium]